MKKFISILFLIMFALPAMAGVVVTLRSGEKVAGEVLFQNNDVIVIKTTEGQRFQYPMTEVSNIAEGEAVQEEEDDSDSRITRGGKKVGIALHLAGGGGIVPAYATGGNFGANIYIGACNLFGRHVFVGGGLGADMYFLPSVITEGKTDSYYFIPVQARFSAPLLQTEHAPALGFAIGYGFSTKGISKSGISASADAGWRWQMSEKSALFAGLTAGVQQTKMDVVETIEEAEYTSTVTRVLWKVGVKMAIQF